MQENATSPTMLMHMSNYIRHICIYKYSKPVLDYV